MPAKMSRISNAPGLDGNVHSSSDVWPNIGNRFLYFLECIQEPGPCFARGRGWLPLAGLAATDDRGFSVRAVAVNYQVLRQSWHLSCVAGERIKRHSSKQSALL